MCFVLWQLIELTLSSLCSQHTFYLWINDIFLQSIRGLISLLSCRHYMWTNWKMSCQHLTSIWISNFNLLYHLSFMHRTINIFTKHFVKSGNAANISLEVWRILLFDFCRLWCKFDAKLKSANSWNNEIISGPLHSPFSK